MIGAHTRRRHRSWAGLAAAVVVAVLAAGVAYAFAGHDGRPGAEAKDPRITTAPATTAPPSTAPPTTVAPPPAWQTAWGSAMAWAYPREEVYNSTVRSLAAIPINGDAVRVRLSNEFGTAPMVIDQATVAQSAGGANVVPSTLATLHFNGQVAVTIPAGQSVMSDPVSMAVVAPETLAVSVYVADQDSITSHYPCCERNSPSYVTNPGTGNQAAKFQWPLTLGNLNLYFAPYSRLLDAVVVERPAAPADVPAAKGSIAVVGDSITDGFNSTARWTDFLQQRIDALPPAERPAVLNEGNTANALTPVIPSDALTGGGPPGLQRLGPDALDLPGVSTVVMLLGTNDLFFGASPQFLISGYQQAAALAHQHGIRIVALTLLPRLGSEKWTPAKQAELAQVNQWLLTSHVFDAVVNMATPMADMYNGACQPTRMFPPYDSGDHLHPNAAGDVVMANAIPPQVLGLPALPDVHPPVAVTPTPHCAGAPGIPAVTQTSAKR